MNQFLGDASRAVKILIAIGVALVLALTQSIQAMGAGPSAIGTGECVQQETGLTG